MTRSVVVTGIGMTTPLGGDAPTTWAAALAGTPGGVRMGADWDPEQPAQIAARMLENPAEILKPVEVRRMDPSEQCAVIAAREAWADAGAPEVDPIRLGTVVASGIGGINSLISAYETLRDKGAARVSPHMVTMIMPNGPAAMVGIEVGARAGVHTPVSACASGAEAVSYAAKMIEDGRADIVVAGGTEACINGVTMAGFGAMRALSTRNDDPATASRAYDMDRDGFVMGEGAGILILEEEEHARARGAKIYGRYGGAGLTSDGHHIAQPDPEGSGAARAITMALEDAELSASDIIHVNAHATSTPQGDFAESVAIRRGLGGQADHAWVSATKSMTGHLLGGAGAVESIFAILALRDRIAPPSINIFNFDPAIELQVTKDGPVQLPAGDIAALNNSFGFGGHDVALVFKSV